MNTPSMETATNVSKAEKPLEDLLDDLVQATEEFKKGVLDLKDLDSAERAMVENFICEGRDIFDDFLNSIKPANDSTES